MFITQLPANYRYLLPWVTKWWLQGFLYFLPYLGLTSMAQCTMLLPWLSVARSRIEAHCSDRILRKKPWKSIMETEDCTSWRLLCSEPLLKPSCVLPWFLASWWNQNLRQTLAFGRHPTDVIVLQALCLWKTLGWWLTTDLSWDLTWRGCSLVFPLVGVFPIPNWLEMINTRGWLRWWAPLCLGLPIPITAFAKEAFCAKWCQIAFRLTFKIGSSAQKARRLDAAWISLYEEWTENLPDQGFHEGFSWLVVPFTKYWCSCTRRKTSLWSQSVFGHLFFLCWRLCGPNSRRCSLVRLGASTTNEFMPPSGPEVPTLASWRSHCNHSTFDFRSRSFESGFFMFFSWRMGSQLVDSQDVSCPKVDFQLTPIILWFIPTK